jgi:glycosyltransferase involved in cell wall biosynthesis
MRILHVFRSPVGGLFRHVRDLARGQHELGHDVAMLCATTEGGSHAESLLKQAERFCTIGVHRAAMSRLPGFGDLGGVRATTALARTLNIDVIHCHGAKGGVYGRLAARRLGIPSVYTPHGGSLHFRWASPSGAVFLSAEKYLGRVGSGFCFVCDFEKQEFASKIGLSDKPSTVVFNGLWPEEFTPSVAVANATDLLFVGEIRHLKGVDILLQAMALVPHASLTIVGDGNEQSTYESLVRSLGLTLRVTFAGRLPIAEALKRGRIMVLPSRNESFPYVVLEAAAARMPVIASAVGGIAEIVPQHLLCHDRSPETLAEKIRMSLTMDKSFVEAAETLFSDVGSRCTAKAMVQSVTDFYGTLKSDGLR